MGPLLHCWRSKAKAVYPCNLYPYSCHVKKRWSPWTSWAGEADGHRPIASLWKGFLISLLISLPGAGSAQPFDSWIHNFPSVLRPHRVLPASSAHFQSFLMNHTPAESLWWAYVKSEIALLCLESGRDPSLSWSLSANILDSLVLSWHARSHFYFIILRVHTSLESTHVWKNY